MAITMKKSHFKKFLPIYLALVCGAIFAPSIEGMKCRIMLKYPKDEFKTYETCQKSNPIDWEKQPRPKPNSTWEEIEFDDNCFQQCVYKAFGQLTPEGTVKKDQIAIRLKDSELDADVLEKLTAIWDGCVDKTEKIGKEKGLTECKILMMHAACYGQTMYKTENLLEESLN